MALNVDLSKTYDSKTNVDVVDGGYVSLPVVGTLLTKDTYVDDNITIGGTIKGRVSVKQGSLNNAATSGVTYTAQTGENTIIPAEGNLYINAGWYDNLSISLGQLIPDDTKYTNAGVGHILSGYEAYDTTGKKLIGTVPTITPTFTGGGVGVNPPTYSDFNPPTATFSYKGAFAGSDGNGNGTYGITKNAPTSGEDGTDFLMIDAYKSASENGSIKATATANRGDVTYSAATTGYVNKTSGTVALAAPSSNASNYSTNSNITATITDNCQPLYVPIVIPSFTGGGVTATAGGSQTTAPQVTYSASAAGKNSSGTVITISNYGVGTTTAASSNGYITFTASGSYTSAGSVTATANASRTAVTYNGNVKGIVSIASGTNASSSATATQATQAIGTTATPVAGTTTLYRIPLTEPTFKGGGVNHSASGTPTNASATISSTGSLKDNADTYGVKSSVPTGTDGINYLTIDGILDATSGSVVPHSTASRDAVIYSQSAGATTAKSDATASAAVGAATVNGTAVSVDVVKNDNFAPLYIPIVKCAHSGGSAKASDNGSAVTTAPVVTTYSKGTFTTATNYGVTTDNLTGTDGTDYLTIDSYGSTTTTGNVRAQHKAVSGAVTYSCSAGITKGGSGNAYGGGTDTSFTDVPVTPTPSGTPTYHVKVSTTSGSASASQKTAATATASTSAARTGSITTTVPTGVLSSAPSDLATYTTGYIKIVPSLSTNKGVATCSATATVSKGITTGVSKSVSKDVDVTVTETKTNMKTWYIKIWDGSYTVA